MNKKLLNLLVFGSLAFTPNSYAGEITAPVGDALYNYSVATDYYYGAKQVSQSPSVAYDLQHGGINNTAINSIKYVFADFMYIQSRVVNKIAQPFSGPITVGRITTSPASCPSSLTSDIQYFAIPQIKGKIDYISGIDPEVLGTCVDGSQITNYLHNIAKVQNVIVHVGWDANFLAALQASTASQINNLADQLVSLITADPNVYGVAFDNESPTLPANVANPFFLRIASKLFNNGTNTKFVFLFDAVGTAGYIYDNGITNVVLLRPLYDDSTSPATGNPVSYTGYSNYYTRAAQAYLENTSNPPVMFVLPASATDEEWDYDVEYVNSNSASKGPENTEIPPISNSAWIPNQPSDCSMFGNDPISQSVINGPSTNQLGLLNVVEQSHFKQSYNQQQPYTTNCNNWNNTLPTGNSMTPMQNYFSLALNAVTAARASVANKQSAKYIGVALYAWRVPGYGAISGALNYSSNVGIFARVVMPEPAAISAFNWQMYQKWGSTPIK